MSLKNNIGVERPVVPLVDAELYRVGDLIRRTEQLILKQFERGLLSGTTHTCLGQELCQMSVVRALDNANDVVLSNHRNHGHFLTYSGKHSALVAEVMGREDGICGGYGGSQHIAYQHFHSNGVQGGMTGIGVGMALARKLSSDPSIVVTIIGDGTLGEGLVYESLNLASIWDLPVLFVVENNGIAQTTNTENTLGGSILKRGEAFGIHSIELDDSHPEFMRDVDSLVGHVRQSGKPGFLVINTERMGPHSKGDDLRPDALKQSIIDRDPLSALGATLEPSVQAEIESSNKQAITEVERLATLSPEATFDTVPSSIFNQALVASNAQAYAQSAPPVSGNVRTHLNHSLKYLLNNDESCILLGEDLHDPYGGAFKVTADLSDAFPGRVLSTPISEAGIVGVAIGLALSGYRPIVEIMFADFLTLCMDQIYNHAVKFPGMFKDTPVSLVIRTPCGGRRGYGPTHSQSPENICVSIPGLTVVYPSHRHDSGLLLADAASSWDYPVLFLEHKLLYGETQDSLNYQELESHPDDVAGHLFPTLVRNNVDADVTLLAYGGILPIVEEVVAFLENEEELSVNVIVPSLLSPLPKNSLLKELENCQCLAVIEESHSQYGVGAEIVAQLAESGFTGKVTRIGTPPIPVPSARSLEIDVLPSRDGIVENILKLFE